jgi:hypothetical protein
VEQPKFKFGDQVRHTVSGRVFYVTRISLCEGGGYYIGDREDSYWGCKVELYQKTNKKL